MADSDLLRRFRGDRRLEGDRQKDGGIGPPRLRPSRRLGYNRHGGQAELPARGTDGAGSPDTPPANKKIGVSVAYLKVPFYANFKAGLEDGAKQFGFTYDLVDGNSGDVATELANLQNFIAQKYDFIILTPSGEGIIPGIKLVNDAGIPIIEANNKAGFGRSEVKVDTYVGADDVDFGRLQGKLLDQAFGGKKARVAYVMGFAGSPAQVLRAKGWDEFRAKNSQYEEVARVTDDFDGAKGARRRPGPAQPVPEGTARRHRHAGPGGERGGRLRHAERPRRGQIHRRRLSGGCPPADP